MSKDTKKGKVAYNTYDEAMVAADALKEKNAEVKAAYFSVVSKHKLRPGFKIADQDKKVQKELNDAKAIWDAVRDEKNVILELAKGMKPKKEGRSTYEYPAEVVTAEDKKKYRTKMRRLNGKPEVAEGDVKKAKKKGKVEEVAPVVVEKTGKDKKKKKKSKVQDED